MPSAVMLLDVSLFAIKSHTWCSCLVFSSKLVSFLATVYALILLKDS